MFNYLSTHKSKLDYSELFNVFLFWLNLVGYFNVDCKNTLFRSHKKRSDIFYDTLGKQMLPHFSQVLLTLRSSRKVRENQLTIKTESMIVKNKNKWDSQGGSDVSGITG